MSTRPKPHRKYINVTAALSLLKTNATRQVRDIIDTSISEIERLQRIEMLALALTTATAAGETQAAKETAEAILELAE